MRKLKYYKLRHIVSALASPDFTIGVVFGDRDEVYNRPDVDKVIAELKSMNESLYLRADNWKALCLASEKAYKKLVKKFVHETSVAESYRSIIFKDDALNALEKDDVVSYNLLSKKSDNCYRHANRWRGIFKKLNEDM